MRRILKTYSMPECLGVYTLAQTKMGVNILYEYFDQKVDLLQILIDEQYGLCAYTGESLTLTNAHNEHLKPQSRCLQEVKEAGLKPGEIDACDLHYENIVVAFTVEGVNPYGAYAKGDWYQPEVFVSPIDADCEEAFQYTLEGQIDVRDEAPRPDAARETIDKLRLNGNGKGGGVLVDNRRGYLEGLLFEIDETTGDVTGELLPQEELERLHRTMSTVDVNGCLKRFAFVVLSVLEDLL